MTDIPVRVDGVVVVTPLDVAAAVVEDCAAAGVPRVWLHRGLGRGSLSHKAVEACYRHGIAVIPGGCPNMFGATSDPGHRGMLRIAPDHREAPAAHRGRPGQRGVTHDARRRPADRRHGPVSGFRVGVNRFKLVAIERPVAMGSLKFWIFRR